MFAVAERVEARRGAPQIDHDQKKRGEGIEQKLRAEPREPDGQRQRLIRRLAEQMGQRHGNARQRDEQRPAIDQDAAERAAMHSER